MEMFLFHGGCFCSVPTGSFAREYSAPPSPPSRRGGFGTAAMDLHPLLCPWPAGAASDPICLGSCALSSSFGLLDPRRLGTTTTLLAPLVGRPPRCIFDSGTLRELRPIPAPWVCRRPCCSGPGGLDLRSSGAWPPSHPHIPLSHATSPSFEARTSGGARCLLGVRHGSPSSGCNPCACPTSSSSTHTLTAWDCSLRSCVPAGRI
ncbi:hypothetical protein VPH35_118708 [Triticum aestivum]